MPVGCLEASGILSALKESYLESMPFKIGRHEVRPGTGFDTDFFSVRAIEVEHWGDENTTGKDYLMPALGFRVRVGQTTVGYTGDTRYCHGAEDVVRDADLAIIESTHRRTPASGPRAHLTEAEAKRLSALAKAHLLIHRAPDDIKIRRPSIPD
jgi:ribonuclease BN (tRNA processing enzyme)